MTSIEREQLHSLLADVVALIDPEVHAELFDRIQAVLLACDVVGHCIPPNNGGILIYNERQRHMETWSPEHDDSHDRAELAVVAADLAVDSTAACVFEYGCEVEDPWGLVLKHRDDRVRQLTIAGALIAAEIDRHLRMKANDRV